MSSRWIALGSIALYLGLLVAVGLWSRRRTDGFRDYVTGGGRIPAWMLALSFLANYISSNSFVGHAARSYQAGLGWCVVGAIVVVCCAVSWHVFAPRFAAFSREHGAETLPDFFEKRFRSRAAGQIAHWIVVVSTLLYALAVLRGTGLVLSSGLQISYAQALLALYAVIVAYCLLGGLWADVTTDVLQAGVLTVGAVALMAAVATAEPAAPVTAPELRPASLGLLIAVGLSGGVKLLADPKQVMVFYGFSDAQAARRFRWVGPVLLAVVYACLFPLGYLARGLVPPPADLEGLIPSLVFEHGLLPSWFGAMFLVALLGASMSSLDSAFLVVASCLEKHVVAPLTSSAPSAGRARALLFAVAALVLGLSFRPLGGIVELTVLAGAVTAAILPAICAGFTSREVPASRVVLSVLAGVAGVVAGKLGPGYLGIKSPWIQDVFVGLLASTLVLLPSVFPIIRARPNAARG